MCNCARLSEVFWSPSSYQGRFNLMVVLTFLIFHSALLSTTVLTCLLRSHKCLVLQPGLVLPFPLEEAHTNLQQSVSSDRFQKQIVEPSSGCSGYPVSQDFNMKVCMRASWPLPFKRSKQVKSSRREELCNKTGCLSCVSPGWLGEKNLYTADLCSSECFAVRWPFQQK